VNPGSKAALQGIREGDVITSMNGQPTEKEVTNSQAHALLKEAGPTLRLGLKQLSRTSRNFLFFFCLFVLHHVILA
jgi:S1-C subfamily serine protease